MAGAGEVKKIPFSGQDRSKFSDGSILIAHLVGMMILLVFVQKMMNFVHRTYDLGLKQPVCLYSA